MNLTGTAPLGNGTQRNREEGPSIAVHELTKFADVIEQRFRVFDGVAREWTKPSLIDG